MPARKKTTAKPRKKPAKKSAPSTVANPKIKLNTNKLAKSLRRKLNRKKIALIIVLVALAVVFVRFRYLVIPATVNGQPIFIGSYAKKLHQAAGNQVLNQMIAENLINQQAKAEGIVISPDEIENEISKLEEQFSQSGGLDQFLATQGINRQDLNSQLTINLKIQKMLEDKIEITDEEIDEYYSENEDLFEDTSEAPVMTANFIV